MERNVHCESNRRPKSAIFITFVCRFGDNTVTKVVMQLKFTLSLKLKQNESVTRVTGLRKR